MKGKDKIEPKLLKHFGDSCTQSPKTFQKWMKNDLEKFKPYGKKVHTFDRI